MKVKIFNRKGLKILDLVWLKDFVFYVHGCLGLNNL